MTEYVIEKGVPLAATTHGGRDSKTGLLARMDLGDSFVVKTRQEAELFRNCARGAGMKIASRKVDGGTRIWRVA